MMIDFKHLKGQEHAKRAIEVALAGNHSLILWGQPGVGKTVFLQAATDLMDSLGKNGLNKPALLDGLQDYIMAGYTKNKADWAGVAVLAASKPCPCGYFGDMVRNCTCTADEIRLFFSSDALDLIKTCCIQVELPLVEYENLSDQRLGESSERIGTRLVRAWAAQAARNPKLSNQQATLETLQADSGPFALDQAGRAILKAATRQLGFTPRSYFDTIKLGRTIADLSDAKTIQASHLAEAIQYRRKNG